MGSGQPEAGAPKALLKAHLGFQFASRSRYTRLPSLCIVRTLLPLNPKDCSIGVPPSPDWTSPSCVKQRIWPSALTRRSPFRMRSPVPSAPRRSWRTLGHLDTSSGGSGGEGTPQTRSRSNPQPVTAVQPPSSSSTVQSLAPAASQMASAWAKVWSRLQRKFSSEPPHTEQPAFFFQVEVGGGVSEQHRTCAATRAQPVSTHCGGVYMCCKRTSCSSFSALSPAVSVQ